METHVFSGYLEAYDPVISIEAIFRILEKKNDFIINNNFTYNFNGNDRYF